MNEVWAVLVICHVPHPTESEAANLRPIVPNVIQPEKYMHHSLE